MQSEAAFKSCFNSFFQFGLRGDLRAQISNKAHFTVYTYGVYFNSYCFIFAYLAPGDALSGEAIDPNTPREVIEERREALGLNDPLHIQYWNWLSRAVTGDLGMSTHFTGRSVSELIAQRLGNTFYLGAFALFVTLIVSIPIGIYSARKKYSPLDYAATSFAFLGLATPNFFAGLLGIYLFSFGLGCSRHRVRLGRLT
ncbi:ABC transporter permease [Bacillus sp. JCM 19041]|uniref:ABC transporter permease n=1 Tax=Bacillus sp. JCM 19041 TaxID=1460637 RepID=UPI000A5F5084